MPYCCLPTLLFGRGIKYQPITFISHIYNIVFSRCQVCVHCVQTSHLMQPPVGICHRCGERNTLILVPENYKFGEVSTPGLEVTRNKDNLYFHLNWRANQLRIQVAKDNKCPSMLVLGCKRGMLPWDPENKLAIKADKEKHPEKFLKPNTAYSKLSVAQVTALAPSLFHCADARWNVDLPRASKLPRMKPPPRVYSCNRPSSSTLKQGNLSTTG